MIDWNLQHFLEAQPFKMIYFIGRRNAVWCVLDCLLTTHTHQVLYSFFKMGVSEGLGSRKVEVLADTAVTLEQGQDGVVASEVIKKLLSVSGWERVWRNGQY